MKIFVQHYSLLDLNKKIKLLQKYLVETKNILEIYADSGQYHIDNSSVYKLIIDDKEIKYYNNYYNNLNLLADSSQIIKTIVNQLPTKVTAMHSKYIYFALHKTSKIKLVIQYIDNLDNFNNLDNLDNLMPIDFYFEINDDIDINNIFIKDELNVFLSLLN